jgi:hypothetical protein
MLKLISACLVTQADVMIHVHECCSQHSGKNFSNFVGNGSGINHASRQALGQCFRVYSVVFTSKLLCALYIAESVNRLQMDIKCETRDIQTWEKHLFLDISFNNIDTHDPSLYQCVETCSIEVFDCCLSHFCTSIFTSLSSAKHLLPRWFFSGPNR